MESPIASQVAEPVSFDIEINRNPDASSAPPVKQRLESLANQGAKDQLTIEKIQQKLERAYERKVELIANQVSQVRENSDRVGLTQERKNSRERAQGQRIIEELGQKQATAEANRNEQLSEIQEKARTFNKRVLLNRERRSSQERAVEERTQHEIAQKLANAEERQAQLLESIQEKAKIHNQKVVALALARQEEEQRELDTKKFQIEEKLNRAATNRSDPAEKARAYNIKVQEKVSTVTSGHLESLEERKARIEAKLCGAASRREGVIEQVKATAAQTAAPRQSAASASPQKSAAAASKEA